MVNNDHISFRSDNDEEEICRLYSVYDDNEYDVDSM